MWERVSTIGSIWGEKIATTVVTYGIDSPAMLPISSKMAGSFVALGPIFFGVSTIIDSTQSYIARNNGVWEWHWATEAQYKNIWQAMMADTFGFAQMSVYLPAALGALTVPHTVFRSPAVALFSTKHSFSNALFAILNRKNEGILFAEIASNIALRNGQTIVGASALRNLESSAFFIATMLGAISSLSYPILHAVGMNEESALYWSQQMAFYSLIFFPSYHPIGASKTLAKNTDVESPTRPDELIESSQATLRTYDKRLPGDLDYSVAYATGLPGYDSNVHNTDSTRPAVTTVDVSETGRTTWTADAGRTVVNGDTVVVMPEDIQITYQIRTTADETHLITVTIDRIAVRYEADIVGPESIRNIPGDKISAGRAPEASGDVPYSEMPADRQPYTDNQNTQTASGYDYNDYRALTTVSGYEMADHVTGTYITPDITLDFTGRGTSFMSTAPPADDIKIISSDVQMSTARSDYAIVTDSATRPYDIAGTRISLDATTSWASADEQPVIETPSETRPASDATRQTIFSNWIEGLPESSDRIEVVINGKTTLSEAEDASIRADRTAQNISSELRNPEISTGLSNPEITHNEVTLDVPEGTDKGTIYVRGAGSGKTTELAPKIVRANLQENENQGKATMVFSNTDLAARQMKDVLEASNLGVKIGFVREDTPNSEIRSIIAKNNVVIMSFSKWVSLYHSGIIHADPILMERISGSRALLDEVDTAAYLPLTQIGMSADQYVDPNSIEHQYWSAVAKKSGALYLGIKLDLTNPGDISVNPDVLPEEMRNGNSEATRNEFLQMANGISTYVHTIPDGRTLIQNLNIKEITAYAQELKAAYPDIPYSEAQIVEHLYNGITAYNQYELRNMYSSESYAVVNRQVVLEADATINTVGIAGISGETRNFDLHLPAGEMQTLEYLHGAKVFTQPLEGDYIGKALDSLDIYGRVDGLTATLSESVEPFFTQKGFTVNRGQVATPEYQLRIAEALSQEFSGIVDAGNGENTLNIVATPNSRLARLNTLTLETRGVNQVEVFKDAGGHWAAKTTPGESNYIRVGLATPEEIAQTMFKTLSNTADYGEVHYVVGSANLIGRALNFPTPLYLANADGKVNVWLVEPELMTATQINQAAGRIAVARFTEIRDENNQIVARINPEKAVISVMSKDTMQYYPEFNPVMTLEGEALNNAARDIMENYIWNRNERDILARSGNDINMVNNIVLSNEVQSRAQEMQANFDSMTQSQSRNAALVYLGEELSSQSNVINQYAAAVVLGKVLTPQEWSTIRMAEMDRSLKDLPLEQPSVISGLQEAKMNVALNEEVSIEYDPNVQKMLTDRLLQEGKLTTQYVQNTVDAWVYNKRVAFAEQGMDVDQIQRATPRIHNIADMAMASWAYYTDKSFGNYKNLVTTVNKVFLDRLNLSNAGAAKILTLWGGFTVRINVNGKYVEFSQAIDRSQSHDVREQQLTIAIKQIDEIVAQADQVKDIFLQTEGRNVAFPTNLGLAIFKVQRDRLHLELMNLDDPKADIDRIYGEKVGVRQNDIEGNLVTDAKVKPVRFDPSKEMSRNLNGLIDAIEEYLHGTEMGKDGFVTSRWYQVEAIRDILANGDINYVWNIEPNGGKSSYIFLLEVLLTSLVMGRKPRIMVLDDFQVDRQNKGEPNKILEQLGFSMVYMNKDSIHQDVSELIKKLKEPGVALVGEGSAYQSVLLFADKTKDAQSGQYRELLNLIIQDARISLDELGTLFNTAPHIIGTGFEYADGKYLDYINASKRLLEAVREIAAEAKLDLNDLEAIRKLVFMPFEIDLGNLMNEVIARHQDGEDYADIFESIAVGDNELNSESTANLKRLAEELKALRLALENKELKLAGLPEYVKIEGNKIKLEGRSDELSFKFVDLVAENLGYEKKGNLSAGEIFLLESKPDTKIMHFVLNAFRRSLYKLEGKDVIGSYDNTAMVIQHVLSQDGRSLNDKLLELEKYFKLGLAKDNISNIVILELPGKVRKVYNSDILEIKGIIEGDYVGKDIPVKFATITSDAEKQVEVMQAIKDMEYRKKFIDTVISEGGIPQPDRRPSNIVEAFFDSAIFTGRFMENEEWNADGVWANGDADGVIMLQFIKRAVENGAQIVVKSGTASTMQDGFERLGIRYLERGEVDVDSYLHLNDYVQPLDNFRDFVNIELNAEIDKANVMLLAIEPVDIENPMSLIKAVVQNRKDIKDLVIIYKDGNSFKINDDESIVEDNIKNRVIQEVIANKKY